MPSSSSETPTVATLVPVPELWLGYRKDAPAEAGMPPRFPGTPGTSSPLRLPQILPPATRALAPTSFLASAPLRILLGYREMTEAAFLRNSADQRPSGLGPRTGARREGGRTCTRCTCGWPGSRCARSWPVLQENRSESSRAAPFPHKEPTERTHLPVRKSVMPSLGLSWGALRLLMAGTGAEHPRDLPAAGRRLRK